MTVRSRACFGEAWAMNGDTARVAATATARATGRAIHHRRRTRASRSSRSSPIATKGPTHLRHDDRLQGHVEPAQSPPDGHEQDEDRGEAEVEGATHVSGLQDDRDDHRASADLPPTQTRPHGGSPAGAGGRRGRRWPRPPRFALDLRDDLLEDLLVLDEAAGRDPRPGRDLPGHGVEDDDARDEALSRTRIRRSLSRASSVPPMLLPSTWT